MRLPVNRIQDTAPVTDSFQPVAALAPSPPSPRANQPGSGTFTVLVAGNPNSGKTTVFNALSGLRTQTANFPGTTVERKSGRLTVAGREIRLVDLPGIYSLDAVSPEEKIAAGMIEGAGGQGRADAVLVVADACHAERSLFLVSQILERGLPVVVALNMMDLAARRGLHMDAARLSDLLGCPVVPMVARREEGVAELKQALAGLPGRPPVAQPELAEPPGANCACATCPFQARYDWTEDLLARCVSAPRRAGDQRTERIDRMLTHPVVGLVAFLGVMLSVFFMIFSVATVPMDLIDAMFARVGGWLTALVPPGDLQSLLVDGIVGGVGGILVFLPQICILFFFLALLEDSGYLARGAFVLDRLMRRVGLPGTAFIPLLSSHACAIPGIMAARVIRDPRDRLVTILVAPLMTCSARIPVYAMITALLFPAQPWKAAFLFTGAYSLGIVAALAVAFLFKKTILPGESKPLVLDLPSYRVPSLKSALHEMVDRAKLFIQQAGTIILVISIVLWALATYPKTEVPPEVVQQRDQAAALAAQGLDEDAARLRGDADAAAGRHALAHSFAGRLGKIIEPVVAPLGFDWQIGIGVVSSFAAREVIVSTLAVVYGVGDAADDEDSAGLYQTLANARHDDGSPVFTVATSISLLVFYVLAMQCLPTQVVTRRETNGWKWPIFQFTYMTVLAYGAAFVAFQLVRLMTG